jgi:hypothetical protein
MRKIESSFIGSTSRLALALHRDPRDLAAARDQHHRAGNDAFVDVLRGRLFDLLELGGREADLLGRRHRHRDLRPRRTRNTDQCQHAEHAPEAVHVRFSRFIGAL